MIRSLLRAPMPTLSIIAALLILTDAADGQQLHSFVLQASPSSNNIDLGSLSANTIFSYDSATKLAVPASSVLVAALNDEAFVDALSYGRDVGGENTHSYFFFGIRKTADGRVHGLSRTAMSREPASECEADFWWARDKHSSSRLHGLNTKAIDENSGSVVRLFNPPGSSPSPSLGLSGRYGVPRTPTFADANNIGAFDLLTGATANQSPVYFSIDRAALGFSPADILCHSGGVITVYRSAADLGLDPVSDNIDALSLNLSGEGAPYPIGWVSLTHDSASLPSFGASGGDVFQFRLDGLSAPEFHLHMTAESLGIGSSVGGLYMSDAEIDSIAHIDPGQPQPCPLAFGSGNITLECGAALDGGFSLLINERWSSSHQGTDTSISFTASASGADRVDVVGAQSPSPFASGFLTTQSSSLFVESGELPRPLNGGATSDELARTIAYSWDTPPASYDAIDVYLDNAGAITLSADATSYTTPPLATGVHTLVVRGRFATQSSLPLSISQTLELPATEIDLLQPPEDVTIISSEPLLSIEWTNASSYETVELYIDGVMATSIAAGAIQARQSLEVGAWVPGHHELAVRGVADIDGVLRSTVGISASFLVTLPVPGAGTPILDAAADIVGATHSFIDGLLVLSSDGVLNHYPSLDDAGSATALTTTGLPGSPPSAISVAAGTLYWLIEGEIWSSPATGGSAALVGSVYPSNEGIASDIAVSGGAVWVADSLNNRVTRHDLTTNSVSAPVQSIGVPGTLRGVALRDSWIQTLLEMDGVYQVALWNSDGSAVASTTLQFADVAPFLAAVDTVADESASLLVSDGTELYRVVALDPVPATGDLNCHTLTLDAAQLTSNNPLSARGALIDTLIFSSATLSAASTVADLDAKIQWSQSDPGEISISLTSPAATTVLLFDDLQVERLEFAHHFDDLLSPGFNDTFGTAAPLVPLAEFDGEVLAGEWSLEVENPTLADGTLEGWQLSFCVAPLVGPIFVRGDVNNSAALDLNDILAVLNFLFNGGAMPSCFAAADINADRNVGIVDVLHGLNYMFNGGPPPAPPFPACGPDANTVLSCNATCD